MAPLLGLLALFFLISARYGAGLNPWGDEAYALNVAAKSVGEILAADPFHMPTYYLLLHPIVSFLAHCQVIAGPWLGAGGGDDSDNSTVKLYLSCHEYPHVCVAVCGLHGVAVDRIPPADARRPQAAARVQLVTIPALAGAPGL
jgi:hypothetical protein